MDSLIVFFAKWGLLIPALLAAAVIVSRKRWKTDLAEAALAGLATILAVKVAGSVVHESRPFVVEHVRPLIAHIADNSFPSDHLAACGLAVVYLWPRSKPAAVLALLAAAALGAARVAARLHWPADIAGGFALGAVGAAVAPLLLAIIARKRDRVR